MASQEAPPSEADHNSPKPSARRANTACLSCRERKVRCSGKHPCANCIRRSTDCVFEQEDRRILVSERYLNNLKRKAELVEDRGTLAKRPCSSSTQLGGRNQAGELPDSHAAICEEDGLPQMQNPLTITPLKFVTDSQGRRRFLGPSSTWAYSRQVMGMIREYLHQDESPAVPLNTDGAAFPLEFPNTKQLGTTISMENLPSLDYAIYLTNTVKFHISQSYHLFDEQSFLRGLFTLYNDGPRPLDAKTRLWYVQYFLIMAFGKALLVRGVSSGSPPGRDYFTRAMDMFPDVNGLYEDPILAVEICCSLALYLQSVDHRNSAYAYLGLGLRISLSQGLHRDAGETWTPEDAFRSRSAWWTLYILDRKFSSLMGAPSSVHDDDISVPFPRPQHAVQRSTALEMHVKLSRLIAKVLDSVYGIDGRLDSSFLKNVQAMLRELAILAEEMNASLELKLDTSGPLSRVSATLNLCYHQCTVLATRPLLMCLLRERLETRSRGDRVSREIVGPVKALLKTSCDSANKSLRILSALHSQHLLETFLPFDLDHAFSAGFVLSLVSAIQPFPTLIDDSYLEVTSDILNTLIASGNVAARFRQEELERLHDMLLLVNRQHVDPEHDDDGAEQAAAALASLDNSMMPQGVSPNQMLSVASLLEDYPGLDMSGTVDNSWLWEGEMPQFV